MRARARAVLRNGDVGGALRGTPSRREKYP